MASPLTRTTTHVGRWQCEACTEWYTSPPVFPYEDKRRCKFCSDCIRSRFDAALEFDVNWPASWGSIELVAEDYASTLGPERLARYQWKKRAMDDYAASTVAEGIEGLVRGKDFQNCPKCHTVIHLETGCNHMPCKCTENFCFLCGEPAGDDSGYWERDGCPRYNHTHHGPLEDEEDERFRQALFAKLAEEDAAAERARELVEIERLEQVAQANTIEIERWAWNVAMQTSNPALRHHMRGFTLPPRDATLDVRPNYPARQHWRPVMHAMQAYTHRHGVIRAEWATFLAEQAAAADETVPRMFRAFLLDTLRNEHEEHETAFYSQDEREPRHYTHHILSASVLLRQPVGGVFNLNYIGGRVNAAQWLSSRILLPTADWPRNVFDHPDNFALLSIGPGGNAATRAEAAEILVAISGGHRGTYVYFEHVHRSVEFLLITDNTVLAHVSQGHHQDHWIPGQRFQTLVNGRRIPSAASDEALLAWVRDLLVSPEANLAILAESRRHRLMPGYPPRIDEPADEESEANRSEDGDDASSDTQSEDVDDTRSNNSGDDGYTWRSESEYTWEWASEAGGFDGEPSTSDDEAQDLEVDPREQQRSAQQIFANLPRAVTLTRQEALGRQSWVRALRGRFQIFGTLDIPAFGAPDYPPIVFQPDAEISEPSVQTPEPHDRRAAPLNWGMSEEESREFHEFARPRRPSTPTPIAFIPDQVLDEIELPPLEWEEGYPAFVPTAKYPDREALERDISERVDRLRGRYW